jgi:hypothetical protein
MTIFDLITEELKAPAPKKASKPWSVEDEGRTGAVTMIDKWVGSKTGKRCDGSKFVAELNDKGKPKNPQQVCFKDNDGNWYIKIPYGTKVIFEAGLKAKNEADAINSAKEAYKNIADGLLDDRIKKAYNLMKEERQYTKKKYKEFYNKI